MLQARFVPSRIARAPCADPSLHRMAGTGPENRVPALVSIALQRL